MSARIEWTGNIQVHHPDPAPARHTCTSQCDGCHSREHCVPATHRFGDLLLCDDCHLTATTTGVDALAWAS